jgi:hypothetical protein
MGQATSGRTSRPIGFFLAWRAPADPLSCPRSLALDRAVALASGLPLRILRNAFRIVEIGPETRPGEQFSRSTLSFVFLVTLSFALDSNVAWFAFLQLNGTAELRLKGKKRRRLRSRLLSLSRVLFCLELPTIGCAVRFCEVSFSAFSCFWPYWITSLISLR